jgi:glucose-1-phosphate cytidylyltransferase
MKCIILAGGYGTRIRDVSDNVPKPMIPIGSYPILWHIMKHYARYGHRDFVVCLGYRGSVIKEFFVNYEAHTRDFTITLGRHKALEYHSNHAEDWSVTLAETGLNAMTGCRIKRVQKYVQGNESFLLTYGDAVSDVDLDALIRFHNSHDRILTITGVCPPGRFGEVKTCNGGRVLAFNEKPQVSGGLISGGFFVCRPELFDYLRDHEDLVFEKDPMNALVADGQVMVYEHGGFWHPMDTSRDYQLLNGLWERGCAPWRLW